MEESRLPMNPSEIGLLVLFFVAAALMFREALDFSEAVARLPLAVSAVTMVGIVVVVVRTFLVSIGRWPEPSGGSLSASQTDDTEMEYEEAEMSESDLLLIVTLTGGYVILGYAIGLLWATPLFAIGYGLLFDLEWRETAIVVAGSLFAVSMFVWLTTLNLTQGVLI